MITSAETPHLYFAYGSNLNESDLRQWCQVHDHGYPLGPSLAPAYLPDHEPVFDHYSLGRQGGVLNLRPCLGQVVPGALFAMDSRGWGALDAKEGVSSGAYQRLPAPVLTEDGSQVAAVTYTVVTPDPRGFVPPSPGYVEIVRQGLQAHGMDDSLLDAAAQGRPLPWAVRHLFVYGTLMKGERRHHYLAGADAVGTCRAARVPGLLLDLGDYPGLLPAANTGSQVGGELYELRRPDVLLPVLDQVEGFSGYQKSGSLFRRALLRATPVAHQTCLAWVYLLARPGGHPVIASGDWRTRT